MANWIGLLREKSWGADFDPADFEEADFDCYGGGWSGELKEKGSWTAGLREK